MYKKAESNNFIDEMDLDLSQPTSKSNHVVNKQNVIEGHAIF